MSFPTVFEVLVYAALVIVAKPVRRDAGNL